MKEKRVYFIDRTEYKYERSIAEINSMTDEEFIEVAEKQGFVYSLEEFAKHWNDESLPWGDSVMRIIEVKVQEDAYEKAELSEIEFDKKSDLIKGVKEQIEKDLNFGDWDALSELLRYIPSKNLLAYLPEEDWGKFV